MGRPTLPTSGATLISRVLTSKQRAHLRSLANPLRPILQVGNEGISDACLRSIGEAFRKRELLKLKVLGTAPETARDTADAIVQALDDTHVVQTIGRTVVLYRPFPEKPEIQLPE